MVNVEKWDLKIWLKEVKGVGINEVFCGVLGYWIKIKDGKIENYQVVVLIMWNGFLCDFEGNIGVFEVLLFNMLMECLDELVEIL